MAVKWTKEKKELLIELWPVHGYLCLDKFEGATHSALKKQAHKLGARRSNKWTLEQNSLLASVYPDMGGACCRMFPFATKTSIIEQAKRIGVLKAGRKLKSVRSDLALQASCA